MRRLVLAVFLNASFVQWAAAQNGDRWLIVPVTSSDDGWIQPMTSSLREELSERGVDVWSPNAAAAQFEANGSAPAPALNEAAIRTWLIRSDAILESLVRGAPAKALDDMEAGAMLSLSNVTELNRTAANAQKVLDTCLFGVRALQELGSAGRAETMALRCRQLVVVGEPTPHMHPPAVEETLASADKAAADQPTVLEVRSDPPGCGVRLNGLLVGATPFAVPHLLSGRYSVQVECDSAERGRVRLVDIGNRATDVFVSVRFDRAVKTRPMLLLRYDDVREVAMHRDRDAVDIGKTVPADSLITVSTLDPFTVELELRRGPAREQAALARVRSTADGPTRGDIALAARTLIAGQCMDFRTLPPSSLPCEFEPASGTQDSEEKEAWPAARTPRRHFISGLTLVAAGSASLLTGYVLLGPRARVSEDWVHALDAGGLGSASFQQKWVNMEQGIFVTSSLGAAALVTAMPLVLPKHSKTPWWAWVSGGLGVGFAAFSVAYGVTTEGQPNTSCSNLITDPTDSRTCVKRSERVTLAVLTGVTAASLLTIPFVYLLRPKTKISPDIEVSRSGGYFGVRGEF
jgi:hypothetical protein